ncbi:MAG: hypothetical protein AB8B87_23795 [Granulosicoccus sp.]
MNVDWIQSAASRYDSCIRDTLHWMLGRELSGSGLLNTKVDPLTGVDYDFSTGLRGPDFTYGWIQGRGLEALVAFAIHYRDIDQQLSARLNQIARSLYSTLAELHIRDGHAFFLYDKMMRPIRQGNDGLEQQATPGSVFTYSDAFVAKGLFAASCHFDPDRSGEYLAYILDVVAAIEDDCFQMNETQILSAAYAKAEANDYGPKMILLGASGLLLDNNRPIEAAFANQFIDDVLERYFDQASGLLLNVPGQDNCNVGHAIEFCGFAFEYLQEQPDNSRIATLAYVLKNSLKTGLQGPGIALSLSATSGKAVSPYYPWWPMPEAIRACALAFTLTGDKSILPLWQQADEAFFSNFWRASQRFAYQTRTEEGPIDFVPATPDLDPGYHTGLSMLSAIKSIENHFSS